jgi:hypothetical protein
VETLSITYGCYQNVTWYIGDWGHYFDMGMIIGQGVLFFFLKKNLILAPYMVQKKFKNAKRPCPSSYGEKVNTSTNYP